MKRVVRCQNCDECGVLLRPGFNSTVHYWCTRLSEYVEPDDGCTFGSQGKPNVATDGVVVELGDYAAVGGYDD